MIGGEANNHYYENLHLRHLKVISVLGRGANGVVFLVVHQSTNQLLALKAGPKRKTNRRCCDDDQGRFGFEKDALMKFDHPLIPKLRGVVETERLIGFVMDYCPGGDLSWLRMQQSDRLFSEDVIRFYAAELVLVLEYVHKLGFVYRDLKPDNVVIQESGHLMLIDFDLSTNLYTKSPASIHVISPKARLSLSPSPSPSPVRQHSQLLLRFCNSGIQPEEAVEEETEAGSERRESSLVVKWNSFVGTEEYMAPEIVSRTSHAFAADWWSLGVVLYEMVYGKTPFRGLDSKETFWRILKKEPELMGEQTALRDLILKMLQKDPAMRISVDEIKAHGFFSGILWERVVDIGRPPYIPLLEMEMGVGVGDEIDMEECVERIFNSGSSSKKAERNVNAKDCTEDSPS